MELNNEISVLKIRRVNLRVQFLALILLLVFALAFCFMDLRISLVFLAAAILYYFLWLRGAKKKYVNDIHRINILSTIGKRIGCEKVELDSGGAITSQTVKGGNLIRHSNLDKALYRCGISGEVDGIGAAVCDIASCEKIDGKADIQVGTWIEFTLPQKVETDGHGDPADAQTRERYRQAIERLASSTGGELHSMIHLDHLSIFLRGRVIANDLWINATPTVGKLSATPLPELEYAIDAAKALL